MRRKRMTWTALGIAAGALLLSPGTAQAQFLFGIPFGFGGGYANRSGLYLRPYYPNMGRGAFPGFNTPPIYNGGGMNPYIYNPMFYNAAFGMGGSLGNNSTALIFPGFSATEVARKRSTMDPALAVGPSYGGIKAAAYDGGASDRQAQLDIMVPEGAEVKLQGATMKQTGTLRHFISPPLDANSKYTYSVQVRWRDSQGEERTATRRVRVWAGAMQRLDFTSKE